MSEFGNRIAAQRDVLHIVNRREQAEELFGLSAGAIERWAAANSLGAETPLVQLVRDVAAKLFFLGNKSQEQITDEYRLLSTEVSRLTQEVALLITRQKNLSKA